MSSDGDSAPENALDETDPRAMRTMGGPKGRQNLPAHPLSHSASGSKSHSFKPKPPRRESAAHWANREASSSSGQQRRTSHMQSTPRDDADDDQDYEDEAEDSENGHAYSEEAGNEQDDREQRRQPQSLRNHIRRAVFRRGPHSARGPAKAKAHEHSAPLNTSRSDPGIDRTSRPTQGHNQSQMLRQGQTARNSNQQHDSRLPPLVRNAQKSDEGSTENARDRTSKHSNQSPFSQKTSNYSGQAIQPHPPTKSSNADQRLSNRYDRKNSSRLRGNPQMGSPRHDDYAYGYPGTADSYGNRGGRSNMEQVHRFYGLDKLDSLGVFPYKNPIDPKKVAQNEYGGVRFSRLELRMAFSFFDINHDNSISMNELQRVLSNFFPSSKAEDFKGILGKEEFMIEDLEDFLLFNELKNFDPVRDIFCLYDPQETGYMSVDSLQFFIENLGLDELSSEDMEALVRAADVDQDGRISLDDFRNMIKANAQKYIDFGAAEFEGMDEEDALDELIQAELTGYEYEEQQYEEQQAINEDEEGPFIEQSAQKNPEANHVEIRTEPKETRASNKWDVNGGDDDI